MLSIFSTTALFLMAVNADGKKAMSLASSDAGKITWASLGAVSTVVGSAAMALAGRRRASLEDDDMQEFARLMLDEANQGICAAANDKFKSDLMPEFVMSLVKKGGNGAKLENLAEEVTEWCSEQSSLGRRRLGEDQSLEAQFIEFGRTLKSDAFRRLGSKATVPAHMFEQCRGYSALATQLIKLGQEDGAILFGASSNGSGEEKTHGCQSIVQGVNRAVIDGEIQGVSVVEDKEGGAIVVADPSLAEQLGKFAVAVTLASGTVVYKLMNLCEYYN